MTETYVLVLGLLGAAAAVVLPILIARWLEDRFPTVHQVLKKALIASVIVLVLGVLAHDYWVGMNSTGRKWTLIIASVCAVLLAVGATAVTVLLQGSLAILGHVWAVLTNILAVVVVMLMFAAASSRFEVVIIAGLTLVYLAVVSSFTLLNRSNIEVSMRSGVQFARLAKLLKDPDVVEYEAEISDAQKDWAGTNVRFYIASFFETIIWLIAVWKLLTVTIAA